ncbi:hypothetical protein [Silvanigrella sp.]|jgi:hypothetical protein|uniref:hypothetical protein n=1 Tax=Silvanigrella sp. TaxID=2024976 RepID=UPI0037CC1035
MEKTIRYAIIILIFMFHINCFSKENGFIWIPLAWTLNYDKSNSDNSEIVIKSVKLILHETETNKNEYSELKSTGKKNNIITINSKFSSKIFFSKKLFEIPAGNYELKGINIEYVNKNKVINNIEISATNPYGNSKSKYVNFLISNNHISPIPEISYESNIIVKEGIINNVSSQVDLIEEDYIYVNDIYNQIKSVKNLIYGNKITFINANSQFPSLQVDGSKIKYPNSNYIGMIIDVSCDIKGILKTVWVNKGDTLQYVFYENVNNSKDKCKVHNVFPQKYYLPNGNWTMQSMTINVKNKVERKFNTSSLLKKDRELKKYFKMTEEFFKYQDIKERTLLKIIELNLTNKQDPKGLYFVGTTEIKKSDLEDIIENKDVKKTVIGDISFYFKRNYEIYTIKKLFSVKKVYNAYSGDQMKKDRIIGDIQLKIILTGTKKNNENLKRFLEQLKEYTTTEIASCVSEQEVSDPLLILNGFIQIQNFKSKSRFLDISNKDFKFISKGLSQEKINKCMEDKLKLFKFSKTFTTPFKAKILFESF